MSYRVSIDFSGYTGPELLVVARHIHDQLNSLASTFPNLPVPASDLQPLIDDYEGKLAAKASRATSAQIAFNLARHELEDALGRNGDYLNGLANGNQAMLNSTGYRVYDTKRTSSNIPPAAPSDLKLRHGDLSGTIVARYHPEKSNSYNEVQTNVGDPNVESGWKYAGMFNGGKATLGGLTPASTLWVRVRTAGKGGEMGAWSDPAKIIVV